MLETPACHEGVHYLDYMNFLYCELNDGKMYFVVKLILIVRNVTVQLQTHNLYFGAV